MAIYLSPIVRRVRSKSLGMSLSLVVIFAYFLFMEHMFVYITVFGRKDNISYSQVPNVKIRIATPGVVLI